MSEPPFDVKRAHQWFAVECNNQCWDLLEKEERSDDESERMIHLAHTAFHHWSEVGKPVNVLRAMVLLANVHNHTRQYVSGRKYAESCLERLPDTEEKNLFDDATVYECVARAYAGTGDREKAQEFKAKASASADQFSDELEKTVFERMLDSGDWHGVE